MKKAILAVAVLLLGSLAFAASDEAAQGKQLVDSKIGCDSATEGQLELIGEYLMEQMHPGEQHEFMDRMMGGEGSQSLRAAHIQMTRAIYCGRTDTPVTYGGMMGMMPMMAMMGRFTSGGSMMGAYSQMMSQGAFAYGGMMGYAYNSSAAQGAQGVAAYPAGWGMMGQPYYAAPYGQQFYGQYGMMGSQDGFGMMYGIGGLLSWILWLLAVAAAVLAIIWLYQQITLQKRGRGKR